jgi:FixJ family two-component response regulator
MEFRCTHRSSIFHFQSMSQQSVTVSLLDDDPSVLKAIGRLLRSAGWAVRTFEDPLAFLDHAAKQSLPVAVIDVCMPAMNGLAVQTHLRNLSPDTRVIFLTSRDDASVREKALAAGAFAFLHKPADDHELLTAIQAAAVRTGGAREAKSTSVAGGSSATPA